MTKLPAYVEITPGKDGGITVNLYVPTYEDGPTMFSLEAERSEDGDWRVHIPWPENMDGQMPPLVSLANGTECASGVIYLGSEED